MIPTKAPSARRFFSERICVTDYAKTFRRGAAKRLSLTVWSPAFGAFDAIAVEARVRARFERIFSKALRADSALRPVIERVEVERHGYKIRAWVAGHAVLTDGDA